MQLPGNLIGVRNILCFRVLEQVIDETGITTILVATDQYPLISEIEKALSQHKVYLISDVLLPWTSALCTRHTDFIRINYSKSFMYALYASLMSGVLCCVS